MNYTRAIGAFITTLYLVAYFMDRQGVEAKEIGLLPFWPAIGAFLFFL